jgi:dTDP-4-amino-4,6-dideoxygalactose transaminase
MFRYDEPKIGLKGDAFIRALVAESIPASGGYAFPLGTKYHQDLDYGAFAAKCPVAERACQHEAMWFPQNMFLGTEEDMDDVVTVIRKVLENKGQLSCD